MSGWLDRKTVREVDVELNRVLQIHKQKTVVLARGCLVQLLKNLHGVDGRQGFEQRFLLLALRRGRMMYHWVFTFTGVLMECSLCDETQQEAKLCRPLTKS